MSSSLSGGVSNTPLTSALDNLEDNLIQFSTKDNRSVFDWFSATFEDWNITKKGRNDFYLDFNDLDKVNNFLLKVGFNKLNDYTLSIKKINGFQNVYELDENIYFCFGNETVKSNEDRYLCQLLMSGQGCREFEKYHNGNWKVLFQEIMKMNYYNFARIDLAYDDFNNNYNIYNIEKKIRNNEFISPFRKCKFYIGMNLGSNITTDGFTIEFGTRGKNMFVIYEKNLERKAKNLEDEYTSSWNRYEMRFVDSKAEELVSKYLLQFEDQTFDFNKFTSSIMFSLLDLKIKNPKQLQKTRWKTDPEWLEFLNVVSKTKLVVDLKIPSTIEKKEIWYNDISTTNAEFFLTNNNFSSFILNNLKLGLKNLKDKNIFRIKNYLNERDNKNYSDEEIKKMISNISLKFENINNVNIFAEVEDEDTGEIIDKDLKILIKKEE